jgi:hypothetical protein
MGKLSDVIGSDVYKAQVPNALQDPVHGGHKPNHCSFIESFDPEIQENSIFKRPLRSFARDGFRPEIVAIMGEAVFGQGIK